MSGFDPRRLARLRDVIAGHVEADRVGGVAWLAACGDDVEVGVAGHLTRGQPEPVRRDSVFRIASMTKPVLAAATLLLVEEGTLRLDDPVDGLLPEMAERRGLPRGGGASDGGTLSPRRAGPPQPPPA